MEEGGPVEQTTLLGLEPKRLTKTVGASTAAIGSLVGAISAVLTTFFLIRPNLAPSTENHAEIVQTAVEPEVTLERYFRHPTVRSTLEKLQAQYPEDTRRLLRNESFRLHRLGTVVSFEVELKGLRGIPIASRWSLFDGATGKRLGDSQDLDPLPLRLDVEKKDADTGTWEMWIDTSGIKASSLFVRIELYDERSGTTVTFRDSDEFSPPHA